MTTQNPWLDFLEESPGTKAAYYSYGDQQGPGQRRKNFFQNQFTDINNQYLGMLGKQIRGGAEPSGSWNDFLGGFNWDDWYQQQVSPEERNPSHLSPRVLWDIFRRQSNP